jgi:DNA-binding MarR family transcriptional regulator
MSRLMPIATLTDSDYCALANFRYRLRHFLAFSEAKASDAGLTPQQQQLLLAVRGFHPQVPNIGMLAERLVLRHHSVVELVDRLERRGMVRRLRDSEDRRQARIHLSRRGERVLARLTIAHCDELRRAGPELVRLLLAILKDQRGGRRADARGVGR